MAKSDEQDFTHISENISLKGDISGNSNVRVAGKIIGSVTIQGDLVIEKSGYVEGEIQAKNAMVAGKIQGNILGGWPPRWQDIPRFQRRHRSRWRRIRRS